MNDCLACLLSSREDCVDCGRPLCDGCYRLAEVEDTDYYGNVTSTYDLVVCQECYSK